MLMSSKNSSPLVLFCQKIYWHSANLPRRDNFITEALSHRATCKFKPDRAWDMIFSKVLSAFSNLLSWPNFFFSCL